MEPLRFAGPVIRLLRLERNWSQETACQGICAVSYLSKIEQGKTEANEALVSLLLERLGARWESNPVMDTLRSRLYEGIFSWDDTYSRQQLEKLEAIWDEHVIVPQYLDFLVIRAYLYQKPEWIPQPLHALLDVRQSALVKLLMKDNNEAYRCYPCPLTAFCVAEEAYLQGNSLRALEYLQIACELAAREGYVHLTMVCQHYMANCYSDIGDLDAIQRHSRIAERLARALGDEEMSAAIAYNLAATRTELGDYPAGYAYFSSLADPSPLALHKLAICCEALGKQAEALAALDRADRATEPGSLDRAICDIVRYRLEHPEFLRDAAYGALLMDTFRRIRVERHSGFVRFHLPRVTQWLTANRQYRQAYALLRNFPAKEASAPVNQE